MSTRLTYADVTPRDQFLNRRKLMASATALAGASLMGGAAMAQRLSFSKTNYGVADGISITSKADATSYNNFYEFGTGKDDPKRHAGQLTIDPWSVEVGGLVKKPGNYDLADLLKGIPLEERIYRFRCVEAWSMVVPWIGFSLADLLNKFEPTSRAKYVAFETLSRPEEMPGIGWNPRFPWPYVAGLRLDEAMHPLTMIATGMYGEALPKQNGAPLRLVVPWKYGFKSIKSIVKITLTDQRPDISWNMVLPNEYKFYSNVNPNVDHPRWSQAEERRIGSGLFSRKIPTRMFNGYEEHVAHLYDGLDLVENF